MYYSTSETEKYSELKKKGKLVVKLFYKNGCPGCTMIKPEWEKLKKVSGYLFEEFDVDADESIVKKYALESVPTILVYKHNDNSLLYAHPPGFPLNAKDFIRRIERFNK